MFESVVEDKNAIFGGKLKPRHIPGTAGTHRRLNPGTSPAMSLLSPALGGGVQMTGALLLLAVAIKSDQMKKVHVGNDQEKAQSE